MTGSKMRWSPSTPSPPTRRSQRHPETPADYLLAVKANQPTLTRRGRGLFHRRPAPPRHDTHRPGQGPWPHRATDRTPLPARSTGSSGERRFPGELRLPGVACIIRVEAHIQRGPALHTETRYYSFLSRPRCRTGRPSGPRALGHREQLALGPRPHLRRRPIPAAARALAPRTWLSSATSRSTWSAQPRTSTPFGYAATSLPGPRPISTTTQCQYAITWIRSPAAATECLLRQSFSHDHIAHSWKVWPTRMNSIFPRRSRQCARPNRSLDRTRYSSTTRFFA